MQFEWLYKEPDHLCTSLLAPAIHVPNRPNDWQKLIEKEEQANMGQKGLTREQLRIQLGIIAFWELYALFWLVTGIVENPQLDEQTVDNFKTASKGMGIVFAFITVAFLIAIGLAAVLS